MKDLKRVMVGLMVILTFNVSIAAIGAEDKAAVEDKAKGKGGISINVDEDGVNISATDKAIDEDTREDSESSGNLHIPLPVKKLIDDAQDDSLVDLALPAMFFLFLLTLLLGRRYLRERTEQRRLDLLRAMIEKGQVVSDSVVKNVLNKEFGEDSCAPKQVKRGYSLTVIGAGLLAYGLVDSGSHGTLIIVSVVLLGVGIGNIAAQRFGRGSLKNSQATQPE